MHRSYFFHQVKYFSFINLLNIDPLKKNSITLIGNIFQDNIAYLEGAVIKWEGIEPVIYSNNSFINNTALYGDINAAFPFKIFLEENLQQKRVCINESLDNCYIQILNISSGENLEISINFMVKDIYNKTIASLNDGY